jgi:hypothetical protein
MSEEAFDALTARVLATPDGKLWMQALEERSGVPVAFAVADWRARIARKRREWGQGSLRAGGS